jgi:hypothetical protein
VTTPHPYAGYYIGEIIMGSQAVKLAGLYLFIISSLSLSFHVVYELPKALKLLQLVLEQPQD